MRRTETVTTIGAPGRKISTIRPPPRLPSFGLQLLNDYRILALRSQRRVLPATASCYVTNGDSSLGSGTVGCGRLPHGDQGCNYVTVFCPLSAWVPSPRNIGYRIGRVGHMLHI